MADGRNVHLGLIFVWQSKKIQTSIFSPQSQYRGTPHSLNPLNPYTPKKSIHTTYCTKYPAYILAYDFPTFSISRLCSLSIYLCLSELFTSSTDYWVYTCFDNITVTYKYIEKCKKNTQKKRIFNIHLSYIINYPDFTIGNKHFFLLYFFPSAALRIHWLFAGFWAPFMYPHACFIIFPVPDKR